MAVTSYLVSLSTLIGGSGSCTWPGWGSSVAAGSRRLTWKTGYIWRSLGRSNSTTCLLIIFLTRYWPTWQFSSFLLGYLVNKFLVSNHIKSLILYRGAGPRYWLAWRLWSACGISMLSCRISWISFICVAKASALTFLILLERGLVGSNPCEDGILYLRKRGIPLWSLTWCCYQWIQLKVANQASCLEGTWRKLWGIVL